MGNCCYGILWYLSEIKRKKYVRSVLAHRQHDTKCLAIEAVGPWRAGISFLWLKSAKSQGCYTSEEHLLTVLQETNIYHY